MQHVGSEGVICYRCTFLKILAKYFSLLKIQKACKDVCGECTRLRNSFEHLKRLAAKKLRQEKVVKNSSSDDDNDDNVVEVNNNDDVILMI